MTVRRVCFVIENLLSAGTELWLTRLIDRLDRDRVQPLLVLTDGTERSASSTWMADCPTLALGLRSLKSPRLPWAVWSLARFLRRHHADVVQVHHADPTYLAVPVARMCRVPTIVQTKYDVGYWLTGRDLKLHRLLRRWVNVTLANCQACRVAAMEQEQAPEREVVVIDNGIDMTSFLKLEPPSLERLTGRPRVGMMANLRPIKDPHNFVTAGLSLLDEFPSVQFRMAGDGELAVELRQRVGASGRAAAFSLLGTVSDPAQFWSETEIGVLCSRSEGMPHVLLEAMAAGRAVVATGVGGNSELIEHGRTGILVPPGDARALADAIAGLLRDPSLAVQIGTAARQAVTNRFGLAEMTRRFEAFYQSLPAGRFSLRDRA